MKNVRKATQSIPILIQTMTFIFSSSRRSSYAVQRIISSWLGVKYFLCLSDFLSFVSPDGLPETVEKAQNLVGESRYVIN